MNKIICGSAIEMLGNLGSNVELVLQNGSYDISDILLPYDQNVFFADTNIGPYGDRELIVRNISNLCLVGDGNVFVTNKYRYANVITFIRCENISLNGISFGHSPEMGGCRGGVLVFKDCQNITISGCTLFGCGTIGLSVINSRQVVFNAGRITQCNSELIYLDDSEACTFENVEMIENETRSIVILHSDDISFKSCNIIRNVVSEWSSPYDPLFYIGNSSGTIVFHASNTIDFPRDQLVNVSERLVVTE